MKLSDAIVAGATVLKTEGPSHEIYRASTGAVYCLDVLTAAQIGLLGRIPNEAEYLMFYWSNQWGATHGTPLMAWMRMTEAHSYRWATVIKQLKSYGA